jgi:hypothetical protein
VPARRQHSASTARLRAGTDRLVLDREASGQSSSDDGSTPSEIPDPAAAWASIRYTIR